MLGKISVVNGCEFLSENGSFRLGETVNYLKANADFGLKPAPQNSKFVRTALLLVLSKQHIAVLSTDLIIWKLGQNCFLSR